MKEILVELKISPLLLRRVEKSIKSGVDTRKRMWYNSVRKIEKEVLKQGDQRMANSPNTNKRHISMRLNIDACVAIEKEYGREGDAKADPFIRALEDLARNVELDSNDLMKIAEEIRKNEIKFNKGGSNA